MFKRVLPVLLVLLLALAGSAGAEKTYVIGIHEDATTQNPWALFGTDGTTWNFALTGFLYSQLAGSILPRYDYAVGLYEDVPTNFVEEELDGKKVVTVTAKVRDGFVWSDGNPLTAEDIAFTYNSVIAFGASNLSGNWPSYVKDFLIKVEAVDKKTVKYYLERMPGLGDWQYGMLTCPILSKAKWEDKVAEALKSDDPVQSIMKYENPDPVTLGAFKFKRWEKGAFWENAVADFPALADETILYKSGGVKIVNKEAGFEWTSGDCSGEVELVLDGPHVDNVLFRIYQNQEAAVMALLKGDIDFWLTPLGIQKGLQDQLAAAGNIKMVKNPNNGMYYMAFNFRRPITGDKAFRKAVATIVNRELVANQILQGVVEPMYGFLPPANGFWYNPNVDNPGAGMTKAERFAEAIRILKEAGYSWVVEPQVDLENNTVEAGWGLIDPDGQTIKPLKFVAPSPAYDPLRSTFALWIQRWLNELGVPVRMKLGLFNAIGEDIFETHDFDFYILGWGLGDPAFPDYFDSFFTSANAGPGGWNAAGYENPEFDETVRKFLGSTSLEEAREHVYKLQEMLADDQVYVVLFTNLAIDAYRADHIEFPYTKVLGGISDTSYGMQDQVKVIK